MWEGIESGLATAFTASNLAVVVIGCFAGTIIGMLPGLGPISAIALMIPITYGLDPAAAMILMAGVYYGAIFGGSTSSILINAPGVAGTVATTFDGYPLARRGQAGKALAIAAYASFTGGTVAALLLIFAAPALASVSLSFQSADYFALMFLGLIAVCAFAGKGYVLKSLLMTVFGLMLATVGTDPTAGVPRFTFGQIDLIDGISFLLLAMACFAISEALMTILKDEDSAQMAASAAKGTMGSLLLKKREVKEIAPAVGRSSVLGFFVGVLPGAGGTIASFLAWGMEKGLARGRDREAFGKGSLRGLAAPETANNAASTGSFVPLLTLGIPGSGTTAVMLGALLSFGIQPGPRLYIEEPAVFWSVIISMYVGNIVLLILNLPLIPYIARLLAVRKEILVPMILFFSLIGVYLVSFNVFDLWLMVLVGVVAIGLRLLDLPLAPMILGFILGDILEDNLRRALIISNGSPDFLWARPSTLFIMAIAALIALVPLLGRWRTGRTVQAGEGG
ncbi:tripartite tricarboxylate transporter permease [Exilibacterium tricleocarpae]|uniref:Tripartite tricarboxylate transporter permease n=1 Tax=Exilibacterium tricleocarpae TaxID=2591008 RepID=A0A545TAN6_9GAMM|nr:tripartite tricarboxylate transporter permease [Exilibacterium tricleocarpae]TQV74268.1 tripartite tricarboxylate transporter permease [Exilibacterium tricleocarpae]